MTEAIGKRLPVVALPFINAAQAEHPAFQASVDRLRAAGVRLLYGPDVLELHEPGTGSQRVRLFPRRLTLETLKPTEPGSPSAGDLNVRENFLYHFKAGVWAAAHGRRTTYQTDGPYAGSLIYMSAILWALRHPLNDHRPITTVARWAVHNVRRRIMPGRDVTVTFADGPLRGPIGHPIINLITYVGGGLYDYDAMMSLGILLKPGQLFVDVGANIGSYSVLAGRIVGASGQVISVEPSPDQLPYLRYNLRYLPAETMICTDPLADQATRAQFVSPGLTTQHLVQSAASDVGIKTSTLDAELARLGCRDGGGFAKIDVEGWEPAVIKGARGWLASRPVGLLVEANGLNHRSPVSWTESVEMLHEHGYEYTWPEFSKRVLHLFSKPQPKSPFEDYLILTPEARAHLQRSASLHIQAV